MTIIEFRRGNGYIILPYLVHYISLNESHTRNKPMREKSLEITEIINALNHLSELELASKSFQASFNSVNIALAKASFSVPTCLSGWTTRHAFR